MDFIFTPEFQERFWAKVNKNGPNGCWEWLGTKRCGYGVFSKNRKLVSSHRTSWFMSGGLIPDGLVLDHLCRNRKCVNPDHLEPVTMRENTLRGVGPTAIAAKSTHCIHGHPFEGDNLVFSRQGFRICKICQRDARKRLCQKRLEARQLLATSEPRRNFNRDKTHCAKGHEYAGDNLIIKSDGSRACKTCKASKWRAPKVEFSE